MHDEKSNKHKSEEPAVQPGAIPTYLLDREQQTRAKVLSNMIKQKRKERAGKWNVPLPKVKGIEEAEMFKVLKTGKRKCMCLTVCLFHYIYIYIPYDQFFFILALFLFLFYFIPLEYMY